MGCEQRVIKRSGLLLCLVGPAGCGKTTFVRELLEKHPNDISRSISMTTRSPRPGEKNGVSYHFVTREEFMQRVSAGELFEWEEVHGNLYGQLNATLLNAVESGNDLLLDIDIKGALNVKKKFSAAAVIVFLVPPSFEVMKQRLLARAPVGAEELERRFKTARAEYEVLLQKAQHDEIDYLVVNDQRDCTAQSLEAILLSERSRLRRLNTNDLKSLCSLP